MKVVLQRVDEASVTIDNKVFSKIDKGLVVLVGFTIDDNINDINYLVDKIKNIRIFDDEDKIMNKSIVDIDGEILSVSQFTLYGNASKGRRPSYDKALSSNEATILYDKFNLALKEANLKYQCGVFKSDMKVSLVNDGPVTIIIESRN